MLRLAPNYRRAPFCCVLVPMSGCLDAMLRQLNVVSKSVASGYLEMRECCHVTFARVAPMLSNVQ